MSPVADDVFTAWELRVSPIHGTGVFAVRGIKAGTQVLEYKGEKITKTESLRRSGVRRAANAEAPVFLFELDADFDLDGDVPDNPAKFMNHSCEENCEVVRTAGKLWIKALRDIVAGEELTFDYGFSPESFFEHKCRCGAKHCLGYIVARHARLKIRTLLARSKK